jgi:N-acetylglucosaminyldiphosphoundecaprenol N-acetyl-beta-D-mannosaminyltransferase
VSTPVDQTTDDTPEITVLGVRVHMVEMPQVVQRFEDWIQHRERCHYVVATGMHGVMEAQRSPGFKSILNEADLFVADGMSLVFVSRLRGVGLRKRVSGADLMKEFISTSEEKGYKHFFYGDTDETLGELVKKLEQEFPDLVVAGVYSPPFRELSQEEDQEQVNIINESGADVVWVGLGLPKQERWMFEHKDRLNAPVLVGVGAAFKFVSGQQTRAPQWMGDRGFEWAWRFIHEPRRVWRRVLIDGPRFAFHIALEQTGLRKYT